MALVLSGCSVRYLGSRNALIHCVILKKADV